MFERFSDEAREVVVRAQSEARALGHCWIGAEHLFLGVLDAPAGPGPADLDRLGLTATIWREAILDVLGTGGRLGPTDTDADALGTLGIDLHEIRRRAEERFGPGALDIPAQDRAGRWWRRRRRCGRAGRWEAPGGHRCQPVGNIPFTDRAKRALERSLREAQTLGDQHIGVEHLVLGLLDPAGNLAVELLHRLGVQPGVVRAAVLAGRGRAA